MIVRLALATAIAVAATPVGACIGPEYSRALIVAELPRTFPRGAIVADVLLPNVVEQTIPGQRIVGKVRRVYQGPKAMRNLLIRQAVSTSCDWLLSNGKSGIVVGKPVGRVNGVLVIEPVLVPRSKGYRLADGYQFPPNFGRDHPSPRRH